MSWCRRGAEIAPQSFDDYRTEYPASWTSKSTPYTRPLPPDAPFVDMGPLETGWLSADIDSSFFTTLACGNMGVRAPFTDTVDTMFAVDCIALTIVTSSDTVESYYGWPIDDENNGFGIGLYDGQDLSDVLPNSVPVGATGTGFDETISSKSILAIPEPATVGVLAIAGLLAIRRLGRLM
jgi:hypothetical protein